MSVSTASKALNDKGRVSVSTRLLVRAVAEQMGYLPVSDRRSSESYSSHLIGLITSDIGGRFSLPILAGAERTLGSKNHSVVLMNGYGDPETEQNRLETMVYTRLLDGIIVVSDDTKPREPIPLLRDMNLPVVYAYAPSLDPRDASIICDNLSAGQSAINEILSLGRTRIAVIGGDERFLASRERAAGVKQAMADAGLRLAAPIRFNDWTEQWGRRSMDMILASNPRVNAVYCMNDLLARGAIDSIEEHGLHVPEDVIVIGTTGISSARAGCRRSRVSIMHWMTSARWPQELSCVHRKDISRSRESSNYHVVLFDDSQRPFRIMAYIR